jgi:thioredoxin reductase (NADPH)
MDGIRGMYDIIIIGGGPAGLTAGIYAARSGMNTLILERSFAGGQMTTTNEIENYPGFETVGGFDLSMKLEAHAKKAGAEIKYEQVERVSLKGAEKKVWASGNEYTAKAIILAMGCHRRSLDADSAEKLQGRGISYCATCDGNFFRGKDTAVVGGGNTALEDALYLSAICARVHLIHRRDKFRGEKKLQEQVFKTQNIEIHYDCVIENVLGEDAVTGVVVKNVKSGQRETISLSGVFVALGTIPTTAIVEGQVEMADARIIAGEDCITSEAGVFAAGDIRQKNLYQIVTAASDGACAASSAAAYIHENF